MNNLAKSNNYTTYKTDLIGEVSFPAIAQRKMDGK